MKLSILILTLRSRAAMLGRLQTELWGQILPYAGEVEILTDDSGIDTIGEKRNRLLQAATGKYVVFIDDDDTISPKYTRLIMEAVEKDVDCASLKGMYSVNGVDDGIFEHSVRYKEWRTTPHRIKYERYPNHLNCIRAEIAKQFKFPDKNHGEDHDWSKQLHESGLLKTEHYIPEIIYYYKYVSKK